MSETQTTEHRGRPHRSEVVSAERRRRRGGTLNRMAQMRLDVFDPEQLDAKTYVYRWVNDDGARMRQATINDDYDFVPTHDIKGFDASTTDSESEDRIRMLVGENKGGKPIYSYLTRKLRTFWEADNEAMVNFRAAQMEGRVFNAELGEEGDLDPSVAYASRNNQIGKTGDGQIRRRGAVT